MVYRYRSAEATNEHSCAGSAERILDAGIELFGMHGFRATSLKMIAARAGVSAPLVIHHYGSKAGLRTACDRHAAETFRPMKTASVEQGTELNPGFVLHQMQQSGSLVPYPFRALTDDPRSSGAVISRLPLRSMSTESWSLRPTRASPSSTRHSSVKPPRTTSSRKTRKGRTHEG